MFYEFAEKFDLLSCQLAIYQMARHDDPKAIEMLWKQIIANGNTLFIYFFFANLLVNIMFFLEELDKLIRPEIKPSDLKNELTENIVRIGKEYVDDDEKYFPLSKKN